MVRGYYDYRDVWTWMKSCVVRAVFNAAALAASLGSRGQFLRQLSSSIWKRVQRFLPMTKANLVSASLRTISCTISYAMTSLLLCPLKNLRFLFLQQPTYPRYREILHYARLSRYTAIKHCPLFMESVYLLLYQSSSNNDFWHPTHSCSRTHKCKHQKIRDTCACS